MDKKLIDNNHIVNIPDGPPCITFIGGSVWIMEMSEKDGFRVNREAFPDWEPDDFVREFLRILEKTIDVRFD